MWIERTVPWDRQPQGAARIRPEISALGLVHALMPGLDAVQYVQDHARPSAPQPIITGTRGITTARATLLGVAMQMHPFVGNETGDTPSNNAVKTLRYPVAIGPNDELTVVWCGYIDTPGGASGADGYGALWALGADGSGNGWGAQQRAMSGGQIRAMTVDSSPAQYITDVQAPGGIAPNTYVAAAYRQTAARVTSFSGVGRVSATSVQGNGTRRSSGFGLDLAGSGNNAPSNNGIPGGTATGHNRCLVCLVFRRALTDEQIFSLLDNPWQVWARDEVLFMPMLAASGQNGTAPGAIWAMGFGLVPGAPSAGSIAPGATLPASLTLAAGAGQASSTAAGATLPVGLALVPGAGRADSTAAGAAWPLSLSWVPGSASGSGSATAPGASWPLGMALAAGQGTASSTAAGAQFPVLVTWSPGAAAGSGAGTAPGAAWPVGLGWAPGAGSATGQGTAPGATLPIGLSLVAGGAQASSNAAGAVLPIAAGWIPGAGSASSGVTAPGAVLPIGLGLVAGAASASSVAAGALWALRLDWIPGQASSQGADFTHFRLYVVAPERRSYRIAPESRAYRIKP